MSNILITGANGQLGNELRKLESNYSNFNFLFTDVKELDITKTNDVEKFFDDNKISFLINCAAYTAVDKAEENKEAAHTLNTEAVKILSHIAKKHNTVMIHISTDYVFNGSNNVPYKESDTTKPNSVYGFSKLQGENEFINSGVKGIIIRTSWLYSEFGNNFVKTMLKLTRERNSLNVIFDQIGTPTYAFDLAKAILSIISDATKLIINNKVPQIYHYSNEGVCSWYDFAKEISDIAGNKCSISPIETFEYPQPANRPHYSILNKSLIKSTFGIIIPNWKDSLKKCIAILNNN